MVDKDSSNPNLQLTSGDEACPPVFVPDADHSELVKPKTKHNQVCMGLNKLIALVSDETGVFAYGDSLRNEVARMIFLTGKRHPKILTLQKFLNIANGNTDIARSRALAVSLVSLEGESLLDGISNLCAALGEMSDPSRLKSADIEALQQVLGALVLLAVVLPLPDPSESSGTDAVMELETTSISGITDKVAADFLEVMIELSHAARRKWHAQWRVSDEGRTVSAGTWILKSAEQSQPSSWHDIDHFNHLIDRVNASEPEIRPKTRATLHDGQRDPNLADADAGVAELPLDPGIVGKTKAKRLLKIQLHQKIGLVISANQPNSPYQKPALRAKVREFFGNLVAIAVPSTAPHNNEELAVRLTDLQTTIHQFNLQAQEAHSRVKPHAQ